MYLDSILYLDFLIITLASYLVGKIFVLRLKKRAKVLKSVIIFQNFSLDKQADESINLPTISMLRPYARILQLCITLYITTKGQHFNREFYTNFLNRLPYSMVY